MMLEFDVVVGWFMRKAGPQGVGVLPRFGFADRFMQNVGSSCEKSVSGITESPSTHWKPGIYPKTDRVFRGVGQPPPGDYLVWHLVARHRRAKGAERREGLVQPGVARSGFRSARPVSLLRTAVKE